MAYTTINKSTDYFNTKLYTGNGSTQSITGVGFQPDFCWFKNRTSAQSNVVVDSIRGRVGLQPNETNTEYTLNSGRDFGTFDSDGFTVLNPEQYNSFNYNTGSIVSWNWKANGAGSANTDGSINSTVSANTTSGFSIVSYTGGGASATIGHGLGVAPKMIMIKCRNSTDKWIVYHNSIGNTKYLSLNTADSETTDSAHFNNTSPTSSVFSVGTSGATSGNGQHFIAYCFAEKTGYSKFGSYTGNGSSTDGPFIYTGFLPSFVMIKCASASSDWFIWDSKREPNNLKDLDLYPNNSSAEDTALGSNGPDFLSNGFKFQSSGTTSGEPNVSGASYIYMAFAEAPLVGSNNVPATAR